MVHLIFKDKKWLSIEGTAEASGTRKGREQGGSAARTGRGRLSPLRAVTHKMVTQRERESVGQLGPVPLQGQVKAGHLGHSATRIIVSREGYRARKTTNIQMTP